MSTWRRWLPLLLSAPAWGAPPCGNVDLRESLGAPRAAESRAGAYAYAAADLLTAATHHRVAALDLAATTLFGEEKSLREAKATDLRRYLKAHPDFFPRLRQARRQEESAFAEHPLTQGHSLDTGGRVAQSLVLANGRGLCLEEKAPATKQNLAKYVRAIPGDLPEIDDDNVLPRLHRALEGNVNRLMTHAFQKWLDEKCAPRLPALPPRLPAESSLAESLEEYSRLSAHAPLRAASGHLYLLRALDEALESGRPAAVALDYFDLYPSPNGKEPQPAATDLTAVVAARRLAGDRCEYFVRTHEASACGFRPELEPLCEKDHGGVWVSSSALAHLYSVISVR